MNPPSLELSRVFKAPIEDVFAAWTDPEALKQWHAPGDVAIPSAVSEKQVGGKRSVVMQVGTDLFELAGNYTVFDPPHKLVYDWNEPTAEDRSSVVTVTFTKIDDNQTEVHLVQTLVENEHGEGSLEGWKGIFTRLEGFLV